MKDILTILQGDVLKKLSEITDESVQCCVTSPPYWGLRDYGHEGQLGLESTPEEYVSKMVEVFREVKRVLRKDGVCWLNIGDSYSGSGGTGNQFGQIKSGLDIVRPAKPANGLKHKDLVGIPWRLAFALQDDGWYLRQDIIWHKPNPMPESVQDRCTKSHEYIFLLTKSAKYFYDADAIKEKAESSTDERDMYRRTGYEKENRDGFVNHLDPNSGAFRNCEGKRNKRSVWTINTQPYPEAHFATFPEEIPKLCILAGTKAGDTVLDPFAGSGTTGKVAIEMGRKAILIELNPEYVNLIEQRCNTTVGFNL